MKLTKPMFAPHTLLIGRIWYFTLRGLTVLTLLYLVLPVLAIVPSLFSSNTFLSYPIPSYSPRWYQNLVTPDERRMVAKNNSIVAPATTIAATALGTLVAIGLNKTSFRGKGLLMTVLVSLVIVPMVVVGVSMYLLFVSLGSASTYIRLILAHVALSVSLMMTTVLATLQGFSYNLVQANPSLGVNLVVTSSRTTLSVIAPGVISGAPFAPAMSLDEAMMTFFLADVDQVTLPRQTFADIHENISPMVVVLAMVLIVSSMCLLLTPEQLWGRATAKAVAQEPLGLGRSL